MATMRISKKTRDARDRGVALLDEHVPDWRTNVDRDELDMTSGHLCVLGQVFGQYTAGRTALGGADVPMHDDSWGTYYGFVGRNIGSDSDDYHAHCDALGRAWREVLSTPIACITTSTD